MPKWKLKNKTTPHTVEDLENIIISNRNVENKERFFAAESLSDSYALETLGSDFFANVSISAELIKEAMAQNKSIVIHGDYDVDGVTSTALLWETLYKKLGYRKVYPYIPDRFEEGYGLSKESLKSVKEKYLTEGGLLITVDCGITAAKEIEDAMDMGIKVVLTDHHQKPEIVPAADAVVWTDKLCGVGITYFLSKEISKDANFGLDLAALGTVSDLQPLVDINRVLVRLGLRALNQKERVGIKALCDAANIGDRNIDTYVIGWMLSPRLNAAGRLETALDSLRLLCTDDIDSAYVYARRLDQINRDRQMKTIRMTEHAENLYNLESGSIITKSEEFHEGVIGLIAGRLSQKYYAPAIAVKVGAEYSKGSARSIPEIDIIKLLRKYEELFIGVGGHQAAAGFTIETSKLATLESKLSLEILEIIKNRDITKTLLAESLLTLSLVGKPLWDSLKKFEPFGTGNPMPLFVTEGLKVVDMRNVGSESNHLSLRLMDEKSGVNVKGIAFGLGYKSEQMDFGDSMDVIYSVNENHWNGRYSYELMIKDLKKSQQ